MECKTLQDEFLGQVNGNRMHEMVSRLCAVLIINLILQNPVEFESLCPPINVQLSSPSPSPPPHPPHTNARHANQFIQHTQRII